tara:strand:- start:11286 stop:11606 length:321 start_codon:yes stop_codon:yes gene_type:complete
MQLTAKRRKTQRSLVLSLFLLCYLLYYFYVAVKTIMIKPNKQEVKVLLIALSLAIGFCLGAFSVSPQIKEKNEQIDELTEIIEELLNRVEFPNKTNHPNNLHKPRQ